MPEFMSHAEVAALREERVSEKIEPYVEYLGTLDIGAWGAIRLKPGDNQRVTKNRLYRAARKLNRHIIYKRSKPGVVLFEVAPAKD